MSATALKSDNRLSLRMPSAAKHIIEQAASVEGKSLNAYIMDHLVPQAKQTIEDHENWVLSRHDAEVFFDSLANPAPLNERMKAALADHDKRVTSR